jgi:hypothetical protein
MARSSNAPPAQRTGLSLERLLALLTAFCGVVIVIGATRQWAGCYVLDTNVYPVAGTDLERGSVVLLAGIALTGICLARALWPIPGGMFGAACLALSAVVLALMLWTRVTVPDVCEKEFLGLRVVEVRYATGIYLTVVGALLALALSTCQLALAGRRA